MEKKPTAAVLGTGSIGQRHMRVLKHLDVPLLAVPTRQTRLQELSAQGWSCAGSLQEAGRAGATIAVIATDTRRHAEDAIAALRLGFHVLLEKPMALTLREAEAIMAVAAQRQRQLFIGCNLRFDPGLQAAREKIGEIGALHSVRIECRSYLPDWRPGRDYRQSYSARADEGGVLRDLIHEVDYALWLFGIPRQVHGELRNLGRLGIQGEELADGRWTTPSGAGVSIGLDYLSRHPLRFLSARGTEGDLEYDFIERRLRLRKIAAPLQEMVFAKSPDDSYIYQMTEFLQVTAGAEPQFIASAQEGLHAMAVCEAWRQSASTNLAAQVQLE